MTITEQKGTEKSLENEIKQWLIDLILFNRIFTKN
jgi:hypothetical protein